MKIRTLGFALLRRWYAAVSGILAIGGICYFLYGAVPVDYKVTGSAVLLPAAQSVGPGGNPYLFLTGLSQAMDVLTRRMSTPETTSRLTARHPSTTYVVAPDVTSGSSILTVTVTSGSRTEASAALDALMSDVPAELKAMQDELKVPSGSRISSMQLAEATTPTPLTKPKIQVVAATGAAGLLVSILLTALLDGLLLRRRRRASRRTLPEPASGHEGVVERDPVLVPAQGPHIDPVGPEAAATRRRRWALHDSR